MAWWNRLRRRRCSCPTHFTGHQGIKRQTRLCVEPVEPRVLLNAAPVFAGAVYIEEDVGTDEHGDAFQLTFNGGAPGTQLARAIISGDQNEPGFGVGDVFFDTVNNPDSLGADHAFPVTLVRNQGIDSVRWTVADGGTMLVFDFEGFDPGDKLTFTIDVDEVEAWDPQQPDMELVNEGFDPITSGVEFQGSQLTVLWSAPHFFAMEATGTFLNRYDSVLAGTSLDLPADDAQGKRDRTAGAVVQAQQQPQLASIRGLVYHDRDRNGVPGPGEEGLAQVQLTIEPIATVLPQAAVTVTTDNSGRYQADGLLAGSYRIRQQQPAGYLDGTDRAGTVNGQPSGRAINPGDLIDEIFLPGSSLGEDYDFGEWLPVSVSGRVFLSSPDGDCSGQTSSLRPLPGIKVTLWDQQGNRVAEQLTDELGRYAFQNLRPGTYSISEETPPGLLDGDAHPGQVNREVRGRVSQDGTIIDIWLDSGDEGRDFDFCEHQPASLSGFVYHDRDNDGTLESGEQGIAGVEVRLLDQLEQTIAIQKTDALGHYEFVMLPAGTYQLVEVQPEAWRDGQDTLGTVDGQARGTMAPRGDRFELITLKFGEQGKDYNFGELLPASIEGTVHLSTSDGDCFSTKLVHPPLANVQVQLLDASGSVFASTFTDQSGHYRFDDLLPGDYTVRELTPPGLLEGGAQAGRRDGLSVGRVVDSNTVADIAILSGQLVTEVDFCEHPPASLSGFVYHDRDNDGALESGEEGIAGVEVRLLDQLEQIIAVQTTDARGHYEFVMLPAGTYQLAEVQPEAWRDGQDMLGTVDGQPRGTMAPGGDRFELITLKFGEQGENYNFAELLPASIEGSVHLSTSDGDCFSTKLVHPPLANVQVQLLDASSSVFASTFTDQNGHYRFDDLLPGDYTVRELTPPGLLEGGAQAGQRDGLSVGRVVDSNTVADIAILSGQIVTDVDFCEHPPANLSGFVYHDANNNGRRDESETAIPQTQIQLLDSDGMVVARTTTDADGAFQFLSLTAGTYQLREVQPAGWMDGRDLPGTVNGLTQGIADDPGDLIREISLKWGDEGIDYQFGELLPARISGTVHADFIVANCTFEAERGDQYLPGVTIELWDDQNHRAAATTTDAQGRFEFNSLLPGRYRLVEIQPAGYFDGDAHAGSAGGQVSGPNAIRDIVLGSGTDAIDYQFCEEPPGEVSGFVFQDGPPILLGPGESLPEDLWPLRDGVFTPDDTPLANVVLELHVGIEARVMLGQNALPGTYPDGPVRTVTDRRGFYRFTGLPKGRYAVYEIQPAGYLDGIDTTISEFATAVNRHRVIGLARLSQLERDPQFDAIIDIVLPPGAVRPQNNFSEIQSAATRPPFTPPGPPFRPLPPPTEPRVPVTEVTPRRALELMTRAARPRVGLRAGEGPTWHLSVIDGGTPRETPARVSELAVRQVASNPWNPQWNHGPMDQMTWHVWVDGAPAPIRQFGTPSAIPVSGDFNGDGVSEIGVFIDGLWLLDLNGNGRWDEQDLRARLGRPGDRPVTGDWDGDGKDDIGIFGRPWPNDPRAIATEPGLPDRQNLPTGETKNLPPRPEDAPYGYRVLQRTVEGPLRADLIDHVFLFGASDSFPIAGDWNGDGIATIGVFRNGHWYLDRNGDGRLTDDDIHAEFGQAGDVPIVGDFNGDGIDDLGFFRNGVFYLDTNRNRQLDAQDHVLAVYQKNGQPIAGDWNGDGVDDVAVVTDDQIHVAHKSSE